ncbi:MAG: 50S ribosomal protein L10 [Candidatus Firestonebacteria bacterium]
MANKATIAKKEAEVNELAEKLTKAKSVIFTDFKKLTVEATSDVRKRFGKQKIEYKVIKNNIIRRALEKINLKELQKFIDGPTGVAISYDDPVISAKVLKEFSAGNENMKVRAGMIEGKVANQAQIKFVADLPSREVLLSKVLGGMKAPMSNLAYVLSGTLSKFVRTLDAVRAAKK